MQYLKYTDTMVLFWNGMVTIPKEDRRYTLLEQKLQETPIDTKAIEDILTYKDILTTGHLYIKNNMLYFKNFILPENLALELFSKRMSEVQVLSLINFCINLSHRNPTLDIENLMREIFSDKHKILPITPNGNTLLVSTSLKDKVNINLSELEGFNLIYYTHTEPSVRIDFFIDYNFPRYLASLLPELGKAGTTKLLQFIEKQHNNPQHPFTFENLHSLIALIKALGFDKNLGKVENLLSLFGQLTEWCTRASLAPYDVRKGSLNIFNYTYILRELVGPSITNTDYTGRTLPLILNFYTADKFVKDLQDMYLDLIKGLDRLANCLNMEMVDVYSENKETIKFYQSSMFYHSRFPDAFAKQIETLFNEQNFAVHTNYFLSNIPKDISTEYITTLELVCSPAVNKLTKFYSDLKDVKSILSVQNNHDFYLKFKARFKLPRLQSVAGIKEWLVLLKARVPITASDQVHLPVGLARLYFNFNQFIEKHTQLKQIYRAEVLTTLEEMANCGMRLKHCLGSSNNYTVTAATSGKGMFYALYKEGELFETVYVALNTNTFLVNLSSSQHYGMQSAVTTDTPYLKETLFKVVCEYINEVFSDNVTESKFTDFTNVTQVLLNYVLGKYSAVPYVDLKKLYDYVATLNEEHPLIKATQYGKNNVWNHLNLTNHLTIDQALQTLIPKEYQSKETVDVELEALKALAKDKVGTDV